MLKVSDLFSGDKIAYRRDGYIQHGTIASISGSRLYLESGYATYVSSVVRIIE